MTHFKSHIFVLLAVLLLSAFSLIACSEDQADNSSENSAALTGTAVTPQPMPAFKAADQKNQIINSQDYKGKVLIVDIWATWCPPCCAEIPDFIALQQEYGPQGLQIIGLSQDESIEDMKEFAQEKALNYPTIFSTSGDMTKVMGQFEKIIGPINGIPTTLIVNRQGNICRYFVGKTEKSDFENVIKPLLAEKI